MRAHPRAGGENTTSTLKLAQTAGSSPRGRGKPRHRLARNRLAGLIPARAGKTRSIMSRAASRQAHPRAGGENSSGMSWFWSLVGSSPRGRGKPGLPEWTFFPARAHPRAGGENGHIVVRLHCERGSSPRGRGKRRRRGRERRGWRLIPARAGKTRGSIEFDPHQQAHPRAGGENRSRSVVPFCLAGSSPRGRGKHPNLS